jgi:transposase
VDLCTTIPGIEAIAAANLIAEMGVNMDQFPCAQHLASWAGLCPGNMRVPASASVEKPGTVTYG